ncbi:MAG: SCO family protein [Actinomycetota bacterium]|nr:SCO family protein [Actinomycetota bacterium]
MIVLILLTVGIDVLVVSRHGAASLQVNQSGVPANVPTSLANLMALAPTPRIPAPAFTLTDQNGMTLSLASFKGHAVVLDFMDPKCIDICPLVSQEFVDAYHSLGSSASSVVFLAVNVNKYHLSTSAVRAFTDGHGLNKIPNWHFFTGNLSSLRKIWSKYGITVQAPSPTADVVHTSIVYFIDSHGRERYIASPTDYHTPQGTVYLPANQLTAWGHGIATISGDLVRS